MKIKTTTEGSQFFSQRFEAIDTVEKWIAAFHAKFPQLCTVTVNRAAVLAALQKSLAKKGTLPEVVGLRVFQNLRIGRRAL